MTPLETIPVMMEGRIVKNGYFPARRYNPRNKKIEQKMGQFKWEELKMTISAFMSPHQTNQGWKVIDD